MLAEFQNQNIATFIYNLINRSRFFYRNFFSCNMPKFYNVSRTQTATQELCLNKIKSEIGQKNKIKIKNYLIK